MNTPTSVRSDFDSLLIDLDACKEARTWATGLNLAEAWETCHRGDWLLWLAGMMADREGWPTKKQVVLAACDCAETALKYVRSGEDRPRQCIETTRAWCRGDASIDDVMAARRAAVYAASADADAGAAANANATAANAGYAAVYAASAAVSAANAGYAAASAANAAANATAANAGYAADYAASGYAGYAACVARSQALAECADIVRRSLPLPTLQAVAR